MIRALGAICLVKVTANVRIDDVIDSTLDLMMTPFAMICKQQQQTIVSNEAGHDKQKQMSNILSGRPGAEQARGQMREHYNNGKQWRICRRGSKFELGAVGEDGRTIRASYEHRLS